MSDFLGLSRPKLPKAPCPHLLDSNDVPEPKEVTLIQEAINEAKRAREESASRRWQPFSGNLDRRGQELEHFIAQHTFILSPVRSIPDELLALIFEFYCGLQWAWQQQYEVGHPTHNSIPIPALILQRVCVRWWKVVKSTPRLWSRLPGLLKVEKGGQILRGFRAFKAQIDRAKLAPLSLRLEWHTPIEALERQRTSVDQANWLLATAEQWEELDFVAPNHREFHEVYSLVRDKLTSLRQLKITFKESVCPNSSERGSKTLEPLSLCPSLRSLQITYPVGSLGDPQCLFPLPSRLRGLALENVRIPDGFYRFSRNFRYLHSLIIVTHFTTAIDRNIAPTPMAEMMELCTLRLAVRGSSPWAAITGLLWIIDHIMCPSLEDLELRATVDLYFMRELKAMMERSGYPQLRRLWLTSNRGLGISEKEALIVLLGKTPSITDLELSCYTDVVRELVLKPSLSSAAQGHEPVLLPNLKRVYASEEHAYAKEMVTSRTTGLPRTMTMATTTTEDAPVRCAELEYLAIHFTQIVPACNMINSLYFPRIQGKESAQKWKSLIGIVGSLSRAIESISGRKEIGQELKKFKRLHEANSLLDTIEIEAPKLDAIQLEYCGLPETMFELLSSTNVSEIRCRMLDILEKLEPIIAPDRIAYRWHIYGVHKDRRMLVYMKGGADGHYSFNRFWRLMSPDPLREIGY